MNRPLPVLALLLLHAPPLLALQNPAPAPLPLPAPNTARPEAAVDAFANLKPGAVPEGSEEDARELFELLMRGTAPTRGERSPIQSFEFDFEILARLDARNTFRALCSYLRPRYCRFSSGDLHLLTGRGPRGPWLKSGEGPAERLVGETYATDRRFLDELLAVCENLMALIEPASMRLVRIERLEVPPALRPQAYMPGGRRSPRAVQPEDLDWLLIETPDCTAFETTRGQGASAIASNQLYQLSLGIDRDSGRPLMALIQPLSEEGTNSLEAVFVVLRRYLPLGDRIVPWQMDVWGADPARREDGMGLRPRWELGVHSGQLDLPLEPEAFLAPE